MHQIMLIEIANNLWHAVHYFSASGIPLSSRMTVVRLEDGGLFLHSPVFIDANLRRDLLDLGEVRFIVAPNKSHRRFLANCASQFPAAQIFLAPGMLKVSEANSYLNELSARSPNPWGPEMDVLIFGGIPALNESIWLHRPSGTLILTDICQCWQGDLPMIAKLFSWATGVNGKFAVPRTVRSMVKDRDAARRSADQVLQWSFDRVIFAHNTIIETRGHDAMSLALKAFA